MDYLQQPKFKLTLGATVYEREMLEYAKVIRNENGFDIATLQLTDTTIFPGTVTTGTAVKLEVTDEGDAYPTNPMFKGIVRFPIIDISGKKKGLTLSCLGAGYGLGQMLVGYEYGTQSLNPALNTITTILTDATHGIIPRYVDRVLEAGAEGDSGFNYDTTDIDTINDAINYIDFPYKPAKDAVNDLVDLVTALKAGSAGPHWIVTTDDHFRLKLLTSTQAGEWTKYYGDSQANATLTYGQDYTSFNFEQVGAEAQYILYYGKWRRPSNGDVWTEDSVSMWGEDGDPHAFTLSASNAFHIVGAKSLRVVSSDDLTSGSVYVPSTQDAALDLEAASLPGTYIPRLEFYALRSAGITFLTVDIWEDLTPKFFAHDILPDLVAADTWYHFSLPVGPYYDTLDETRDFVWEDFATGPDWDNINFIAFTLNLDTGQYFHVDGFHIGNVPISRAAYNSDITPYSMKLIVDDVGKDDTLKAGVANATGLMAQLAYAELLRSQKTCYMGSAVCGMLPEALPGQWFYLQEDMRATKIVHEIKMAKDTYGFSSTLFLTDDLTNGKTRMRYEDLNKVYAGIRPEWQDRQASNIKAGNVDWRVTRIAVDY